jgi:hypothetical protein
MAILRHKRPWMFSALAALVIAGLALVLVPGIEGQGKNDVKEKDKSEITKKKAKPKPPPATFPTRKDFIDPSQGGTEHVGLIDEALRKGWKENNTYPSERCTDNEFIRRASLDIIGRIPTVKEINTFLSQSPEKRRSWLINALLDGKEYGEGREYAQNFANMWTVSLLTRTGSGEYYQMQMNDWLYNHFKGTEKGPPDWSAAARGLIAGEGDTNRNGAVNYLLHNLGEQIMKDPEKNGKWDMVPATSRTTKLFLGIRTQCVQCHDHPFSGEWGQHHFWGINAFLRQVDSNGRPLAMAKKKGEVGKQQFTLKDRKDYNSTNLIGYERRNTVLLFTDPSYLNGRKIPKNFQGTRREALAKFVTEDPYFAKAFVNRMWGHFFGKSMTRENADDFGEHNPISHPDLLEQLGEDWAKKYAHNPKVLIRWICNTQAYGLSSKANEWNDKTDDETLFARMLLKPMTPEQMFESLLIATQAKLGKTPDEKEKAKKDWLDRLTVNFGNDEGEEGSFTGTVVQALLLMNGQDINRAISEKGATVDMIVSKRGASYNSLKLAVQDLTMHTLGRPATDKEVKDFMNPKMFNYRNPQQNPPTTPQFWTNYYQDIFWALLNSNEFILNH